MDVTSSTYEVLEIDPSDDRSMTRFVEFENANRDGRKRSVEDRRALLDVLWSATFLVAEDAEGAWVAVVFGSTQEVDGGKSVHVQAASLPGHDGALAPLVDSLAGWDGGAGADAIVVHLPEPNEEELRRWAEIGFEVAGMRKGWRLDVTAAAPAEIPTIEGVRVVSLADHPELVESAHAAWCDAYRAIPDDLVSDAIPSFDSWSAELVRDGEGSMPSSLLVAVDDADRVIGVGYLCTYGQAAGHAMHRFTGVVEDWRGRGVARLLKASQVDWATRNGLVELRGSNNERNVAMLHLNEQLGYEPTSTIVMLRRPR